ncbi:MAG: DUF1016 family protein [Candidatus Methanomethylophilaceae archaeon]|nr:DUF1016 family protein [Candidatus Methanomethylophilaceae archaeon]
MNREVHTGITILDDPTFSDDIINDACIIIDTCRESAYRSVNIQLIRRNWLLGKRIANEELTGGNEENYGKAIVKNLSEELTSRYGKGYTQRNLYNYIRFYKLFPDILHAVSANSPLLTWTHYRALLNVFDDEARKWYSREAYDQNWSARTLERNISTQYYHRLMSSQNKAPVEKEMMEKTKEYQGNDKLEFIKNPVVAEFLDISIDQKYRESDLETAIIDNLQKFLLEMGKGYAFVSRQKHIRTEHSDFFIDLVFYNIYLKCYVLIDLKTGTLTHQDIGQMDMYVRMFDDLELTEGDNPTIGIILCDETDRDVVHYSVLRDKERLFAAKYLTYLPSEDELIKEIEAQKAIYFSEHPE